MRTSMHLRTSAHAQKLRTHALAQARMQACARAFHPRCQGARALCTFECVRACVSACVSACVRVCMPECVGAWARACVRACTNACVHKCVGVQVRACVRQRAHGCSAAQHVFVGSAQACLHASTSAALVWPRALGLMRVCIRVDATAWRVALTCPSVCVCVCLSTSVNMHMPTYCCAWTCV